jgi:hypothetical protein
LGGEVALQLSTSTHCLADGSDLLRYTAAEGFEGGGRSFRGSLYRGLGLGEFPEGRGSKTNRKTLPDVGVIGLDVREDL